MKQKYEKTLLIITRFTDEDVITTSDINNAYTDLEELNEQGRSGRRAVPTR